MSKLVMCAVWDRAIEAYMRPFFVPHVGLALRSFTDEVKGNAAEGGPLRAHPEDFDLFELGTFNEEDACYVPLEAPRRIVRGQDLKG